MHIFDMFIYMFACFATCCTKVIHPYKLLYGRCNLLLLIYRKETNPNYIYMHDMCYNNADHVYMYARRDEVIGFYVKHINQIKIMF
jgi:hypothetical protein